MPKYISGRSKVTPQSVLTSDRYRYLSVNDAEPNLGDPIVGPSSIGAKPLVSGQQYIVVSVEGHPGERYWIPNQGGLIPGSISVFEEDSLVGGASSTTQLNFVGNSITAQGTSGPPPGIAVTVIVAPPGNDTQVLFKNSGDFSTDNRFIFNDGLLTAGDRINVGTGGTVITTTDSGFVGINTTSPTQELHVQGDLKLTGTIYDSLDNPGSTGELIVKTASGGLIWVNPNSTVTGAGGTVGQMQFHNTAGLVDGADNFYFDYINNRVGIGSTIPSTLLDVLGISTFNGGVFIDNLYVSGIATFSSIDVDGRTELDDLNVSGISTFTSDVDINASIDVDGHTNLDNVSISGITTFSSDVNVNTKLNISGDLDVDGQTEVDNLNVSGIATVQNLDLELLTLDYFQVTGITTLGNIKIDGFTQPNTIQTTIGNLILDSFSGTTQISDNLYVSETTQSIDKNTGSIIAEGGVGIEKNLNVGGNLNIGGATTLNGNIDANGDLDVDGQTELDTLNVSIAATISNLTLNNPGVSVDQILDEDDLVSDRDDALATQQSIKAYVDAQFTAQDLNFSGDTGSGNVVLDGQIFTISGQTNEVETSASNQTLTIGLTTTGVLAGSYGSSTQVGTFTVDTKGRITSASNVGINFSTATVAQSDTVKTTSRDTDSTHYLTFVDSNNVTGNYESVYTDGDITYNPSDNLLTVNKIRINGLSDSSNSYGNAGAVLRSDGTNAFWDDTPLFSPYYKGTVVRGYTIGGYQNAVAYNTAYKTIHSTDTTSNLGAIMSYYDAYTAGASDGTFAYVFNGYATTGHLDSGTGINKLNMTTDANVSLATVMNNSKNATSTMRYRFNHAYVFGNTDPEKFTYSTETPVVASTTWANRNSGGLSQNTAYGDNIGYFAYTGSGQSLTFATESWNTWSPDSIGNGAWKCISSFTGYIYWKNSATTFLKYNSNNASTSQQTVTTPSQQEENYHTGESKGYLVGMYDGAWQSTGGILDYISDTFVNASSANAPAINSSAAGVEFGKYGI